MKMHVLAILFSYPSFCLCMYIIIFVSAHNALFKNKIFNKLIVTIVSNFQRINIIFSSQICSKWFEGGPSYEENQSTV